MPKLVWVAINLIKKELPKFDNPFNLTYEIKKERPKDEFV